MAHTALLDHLVRASADRYPDRPALVHGSARYTYAQLDALIDQVASGLLSLGLARGERVGMYLDKRPEMVASAFGAARAGGVFVPVNPLLKGDQVGYILQDCAVSILITSAERFALIEPRLRGLPGLRHVVLVDGAGGEGQGVAAHAWADVMTGPPRAAHRAIDVDMLAILYTSGSTGRPKGVVLSHRNMVEGARSVSHYLGNHPDDVLLAALPLSFDAGFSQLTTAFNVGASVVLLNYLLPKDVLNTVQRERITGLTGVPPLWIQLATLKWPATVTEHLRYIANTGGRMPRPVLDSLRAALPKTKPFLMYGLTEAFRSTYLPPEEVDRRPDSIGKAIPGAEILVLREDGTECGPNEPGELVHRGALVGMGYWNDPEKTAERYRPLPGREKGLVLPEMAVFSGDTVRRDEQGFLYFVGRRDEMIKTSGYRVSPTEIEEAVYATGLVAEVAAFGVADDALGQTISIVILPRDAAAFSVPELIRALKAAVPAYMVPHRVEVATSALPRNQNGKLDRPAILKALNDAKASAAAGSAA